MMKEQEMVREFHRTFGLRVREVPESNVVLEVGIRRSRLMEEELKEYNLAVINDNMVEVADALGDLLYVVLGSAVEHGIDLAPVFEEIHRSNMTKVGGYKNEYGKFVKPDTYSPANLEPILRLQRAKRVANGIDNN